MTNTSSLWTHALNTMGYNVETDRRHMHLGSCDVTCIFPLLFSLSPCPTRKHAAISIWRNGHDYFWCCKRTERTYYSLWCERYLKDIYSTLEFNFSFRTSKININGSLKIHFPKLYFYLLQYLCFYRRWHLPVMETHYIVLYRLF